VNPARALAGALAAAAALAAYAVLVEPRRLRVVRHELRLPGWPAELDGLRIGVVSDLHAGGPHVPLRRVRAVARRVARERPDLVVLLGDFVDREALLARPEDPRDVARVLAAELRPPRGAFAVLGNHDWRSAGHAVPRALRAAGIAALENEARRAGEGLWIAGVADATERDPDLRRALAPVPPAEPVLLLSHDPDVFPYVPPRVALTLAGHTHGSQIAIPLVRERVTPSQHGSRYAGGLVEEGGRLMYVSKGVGESRIPVRLGAPPEIAVLTLRAGG
jgi:uncharacterized protein